MNRTSRSQKRLDIARLPEEMYAKTKTPHSRITARISRKRQSGRRAILSAPPERAAGTTANNHVQLADNERTGDAYEPLLYHYPSRALRSRGVRERFRTTAATKQRATECEPDDRGTQTDVHHHQEQPHQDGLEDAGGALQLQGHGGCPHLRPVGSPRRRLSGPILLRSERCTEGGQRRLEDFEGRLGLGAQGVLRYVREGLRFAHRRQGRRNGFDGP